jgi:translocation and assembly module TamB
MADSAHDTPLPVPRASAPRTRGWLRVTGFAAAGLFLLGVLAAGAALSWLGYTTAGARFALGLAAPLRAADVQGSLLGGSLAMSRLEIALPNGQQLVLDQPRWDGFSWRREARAAWGVALHAKRLSAQRLAITGTARPSTQPPGPPGAIAIPFGLTIDRLSVGELVFAEAMRERPLRELAVRLTLGAGNATDVTHRADDLRFTWDALAIAGRAQIGARAPLPLAADLTLAPAPGRVLNPNLPQDWTASVQASGPLERLALAATVRARDQSLDAKAELLPFAPQPVSALQATAKQLNVAALFSDAPTTALTGRVDVRLQPAAAPGRQSVSIDADLRNDAAGPYAETRALPVRSFVVSATGDARDPKRGRVESLRAELGDRSRSAGRVEGSGTWSLDGDGAARTLQIGFDGRIGELRPAVVDTRAPALRLSGPLRLSLVLPQAASAAPPRFDIDAQLDGRSEQLAHLPQTQLRLKARGTPSAVVIEQADARAGAQRAQLAGEWTRGAQRTRASGRLALEAFDPTVWLPPASPAAWRRATNRLDGDLTFNLDTPNRLPPKTSDLLAALQGQAELTLRDSVLAGVPLAGTAALRSTTGAMLAAKADLRSGASELKLDGELDTRSGAGSGSGARDRWSLAWRAPSLDTFTPLARLAGVTLPSGDTEGKLDMVGRWPQARIAGSASSNALRVGTVALQKATASLQWGAAADDPLDLKLDAARLALDGNARAIQGLAVAVQGTRAAHRATLRGQADLSPTEPANGATTNAAANSTTRRVRAQIAAQGGLATEGNALGWAGTVEQIELRDVSKTADPKAAAWLSAANAPLRARRSADGAVAVEVGATRLVVPEAAVRIETFQWSQRVGAAPDAALRAQLETIEVAPLLVRAQPDFGWGGDLRIGGTLDWKLRAGQVEADAEIARLDGDLFVYDPASPRGIDPLRLTRARLNANVRQGVWRLEQDIVGQNLGTLRGQQTARTNPSALVPPRDAALQGTLDLNVANLGAWSLWLPAGWRLSGEAATQLRVSGSVGSPQLTGEVLGERIGVQNALQGVEVRDAKVRIGMAGTTARIDEFTARGSEAAPGGGGVITATGDARLGDAPRAQVTLRADKFALLHRVDRRVTVSGQTQLTIDTARTAFTGQVRIDQGRFDISQADAPSLDDDVDVRRTKDISPEDEEKRAQARERRRVLALDLRLDAGDDLRLAGRGIDTRLAGELRLTSPANRLAVNGTIQAVGGTYAAYGQKLNIERGIIAFGGPANNPRLDIQAVRPEPPGATGDEVRVGVAITGSAQNPRVRLFSEPEMSETDKLSWLIMGRASDGLGRTDLALLQRAAYALLAGQSDAPSVIELVGLDELSVRQNDGTVRETVVTLGKQLSRRWYVGYERSLNAATGTWQLIYRVAQRFTVRAQSGVENSLDFIWQWRWN